MSMQNLLAALTFFAASGLGAGIGVTSIRQPGASIDASLQNEADHAVRQAAVWLAAGQNPDGSWGSSNRVRLTSLVLLALSASRQPGFSDATARAALWLDAHATNRVCDLDTHAWRLLALTQLLPDTPARGACLLRLSASARPLEAAAPAEARRLWSEALAAAGLGSVPSAPPDAPERLAALAADWPPAHADNATAWQLAHRINREGNGQLLRGNAPLDWRRDLAQRVVNTLRSDPAGGGYWDAAGTDGRLAETALGLLTLLEL